jgi:hypothetical protein
MKNAVGKAIGQAKIKASRHASRNNSPVPLNFIAMIQPLITDAIKSDISTELNNLNFNL